MNIAYPKKIDISKEDWHRWFAWHPVRIDDNRLRWWESVERRGKFYDDSCGGMWVYEYRVPGNGNEPL